jgi:hypothetical protein
MDTIVLATGRTPWGASGDGQAHGLLRVFPPIQRRLEHGHDIRCLRSDGYVRYEVSRFPGWPLPLADGTTVSAGDPVIIIHFDNHVLAEQARTLPTRQALAWWMYRTGEQDFKSLARLAHDGTVPAEIRAVWGETILHTALARMGFHNRHAPRSLRTPFARLYQLALRAIYGRPGFDGAQARHHYHGEAWLSIEEFKDRFS